MRLVRVDPGTFLMGSPVGEPGREADETLHPVSITKPYWIGAYEVTRAEFRQFVTRSQYRTEAETDGRGSDGWNVVQKRWHRDLMYTWHNSGFPQTDERPVVLVSWNDAQRFCAWLSEADGRTYRLPTEAEWEYACRAGSQARFCFGDDVRELHHYANVADGALLRAASVGHSTGGEDGFAFTAPVGRYRPSPWGTYDMHGNVWEWCEDVYHPGYPPPAGSPAPVIPGSRRVLRGGAWDNGSHYARSAKRDKHPPNWRTAIVGFRVVAELPGGDAGSADGPFVLVSTHPGKVVGAAAAAGSPVQIQNYSPSNPGQRWHTVPAGGGWVYLEQESSKLVLSAGDAPGGAGVVVRPKATGDPRQLFEARSAGPDGEVRLVCRGGGDVLAVESGRRDDGTRLLLCAESAAPDQRFRLAPAPDRARPAGGTPRRPEAKVGATGECPVAGGPGMVFCWVPAGTAKLGSPKTETGRGPFEDDRDFRTDGFWLGKYEVTQGEWQALMGTNPSHHRRGTGAPAPDADTSRHPVEQVSREDCERFVERLNAQPAARAAFPVPGRFVIPTEDEWEYACRGGLGPDRPFYFGAGHNGTQANADGRKAYRAPLGLFAGGTTPVGRYEPVAPHPWGLCDMHGNVWEFCDSVRPPGRRVIRGGCYGSPCHECRSACRNFPTPDIVKYTNLGFRVCFRPEPPPR